ncbi:MAG: HIT family protein [Vampirovibrionales bacterium]|nr:HIT family protein [Vampirovibrionales bacterium]
MAACLGFFSLGAPTNKPNETSSLSRIVLGEAKNKPIFENRHAAVLMNADPASPGSAMVVAKRPVQFFKDLSSEEGASIFKLAQHYQEFWNNHPLNKGKAVHYTLLVNDGPLAGQTDPQFHLHIMPATAENPIRPGTIKYAINPHAKGLPWSASGWTQRFKEIHAPINAEKHYLRQFIKNNQLTSKFDTAA